jgi:hypothetical protein
MACIVFTLKHVTGRSVILPFFDIREPVNRMLFCINFYIFFDSLFFPLWLPFFQQFHWLGYLSSDGMCRRCYCRIPN